MRKIYEKVSIKSKYLNYLIRKSNAKKNYSNIENTKKFLKKYEKIKKLQSIRKIFKQRKL